MKALATGTALELERLYVGGNKTSVAAMALATHLKQSRADLLVCWKKELRGAASLCTVGNVYNNSPAHAAGLRSGDSIVAFGPVQSAEFKSVSDSLVPVVKANVAKPIDVVCVRMDGDAQARGGAPRRPHRRARAYTWATSDAVCAISS